MSGRKSRGWESERAGPRRSRGSSPRSWRRSRSTSRGRRRSPRNTRASPSGNRRRPVSRQDTRGRPDRRSFERERFRRSRSRSGGRYEPVSRSGDGFEPASRSGDRFDPINRSGDSFEPINNYEAPAIYETPQRFSPPPPREYDISLHTPETPQLDNEEILNGSLANMETIPEFDPENSQLTAREWIRVVDLVAQKKKWTKEEKKYHMSQKLIGVGRQWYLATNKADCIWTALKQQFISAFPSDMDYYTLLHNMFERKKKKDESYASYFTQKVGLLENCGITGGKAISCIIGGLPSSKIRESAFRQHFKTVDSLYEYLREDEKQESNTSFEAEKKLQKVQVVKERTVKCFSCGGRDHLKKHCRKAIASDKIMFGALGKVQTVDRYYVDVQVNGTLFRGYIDFKSAVCTIREETAKFAGLDYQRCYESVMGFNGYSVSTVGQVKAAIAIDQGLAIVDVYICPDHIQAIPVIVGQNFLRRPDILVMQDDKSINIYQQGENANFPGRGPASYPFAMQGKYVDCFS